MTSDKFAHNVLFGDEKQAAAAFEALIAEQRERIEANAVRILAEYRKAREQVAAARRDTAVSKREFEAMMDAAPEEKK